MKKIFVGIFALLASMSTSADPFNIPGPDSQECVRDPARGHFICTIYNTPTFVNYRFIDPADGVSKIGRTGGTQQIDCVKEEFCYLKATSEFAGNSQAGRYWVTAGFYIYKGTAYRAGTGPLMEELGVNEHVQSNASLPVYNAWCNPVMEDDCYFNNLKVAKADLPHHIPASFSPGDPGVDNCEIVFCYNKSGEIVGLNREFAF